MDNILLGFAQMFDPVMMLLLVAGTFMGLVIGAVPGLTTNMAIAIMVPFTFAMEPVAALVFLTAIYCAGMYGGSIAAILIGIPGTGAAVVTTLDGHPLARQGRAGYAIYLSLMGSVIGGLFSAVVLLFAAPPLAEVAVRFGPGEFFALGIFGVSTVASMSESKSVIRGLISGVLGLMLTVVGISPVLGLERFTFGLYQLMDGFPQVPVFIGLFGIGAIFTSMKKKRETEDATIFKVEKMWFPLRGFFKYWRNLIRSSVIGTIIGIIPGPGAVAASFMAYDRAKRTSKHPENFGNGEPEGIVACETANNAIVGGSLVPLMALGVPGNSVSALFLGALLIHGLRPGPSLFREAPDAAYGMLISMFLANIVMIPFGLWLGKVFSWFLKIPEALMKALILGICMIGTFALRNNIGDVYIMVGFGVVYFFMKKVDLPVSPLVLGLILGPMIEKSFHQAWTIFGGDMSFLVTRPIPLVLMLISAWSLYSGIRGSLKANAGKKTAAAG